MCSAVSIRPLLKLSGVSHYAEMVREARRQRRLVDGGLIDWVVLRNRLSALGSRNKRLVGEGVDRLAGQLGFRSVDGFAERRDLSRVFSARTDCARRP